MTENMELISALAATCYVLDHQVDEESGRTCWYRHNDDSRAPGASDGNYIGGLLRDAGVPSTSYVLEPDQVHNMVVTEILNLHACLVQFRHPRGLRGLRWGAAYGMGPEGLFITCALPPDEDGLGPTELWPNVTGEMVALSERAPRAVQIELVHLSAD